MDGVFQSLAGDSRKSHEMILATRLQKFFNFTSSVRITAPETPDKLHIKTCVNITLTDAFILLFDTSIATVGYIVTQTHSVKKLMLGRGRLDGSI